MRLILVLLFVLQLTALIQSQSDGYGGSPSDGGGDGDNIQPSATIVVPSQTSEGGPNAPTATSQTAGQTSEVSYSTYNTTPTTASTNTQPQTTKRTRSRESASQTASSSNSENNAGDSSHSGNDSNSDNIGPIVGGVVGGVVGLALIGGLLAWLNRRGGCTSGRKRRRHNTTFDDFALNTDSSMQASNIDVTGVSDTTGGSTSPFQRRMVPMAQNSYMDLGNTNDNYSETTTAVPPSGYPTAALRDSFKQHPSDTYYGYTDNQYLDSWQHYDHSVTSPQTPNTYDRRVKPDAVDYKPHQI